MKCILCDEGDGMKKTQEIMSLFVRTTAHSCTECEMEVPSHSQMGRKTFHKTHTHRIIQAS